MLLWKAPWKLSRGQLEAARWPWKQADREECRHRERGVLVCPKVMFTVPSVKKFLLAMGFEHDWGCARQALALSSNPFLLLAALCLPTPKTVCQLS